MSFAGELKCHRCLKCNGYGCPDMLPGLGGVMGGVNFQANCADWKALAGTVSSEALDAVEVFPSKLRCGPVTGAVENIGFANEGDFYYPYLRNAYDAGFGLCIGDGCPDEKLKFGIAAVEKIEKDAGVDVGTGAGGLTLDAAFFLKPYPQERLFERIEWIGSHARYIGIDIDSYNILTMRNLVNLERKTAAQLEEFRKRAGVPFVIKGVFTDEDIELLLQVLCLHLLRPGLQHRSYQGHGSLPQGSRHPHPRALETQRGKPGHRGGDAARPCELRNQYHRHRPDQHAPGRL